METYNYLSNCKDVNLNISTIQHAYLDKRWKYDNVCSSFSRLYFPISGEGIVKYGGKTIKLTPGNVYIIPSRLKFSYDCESTLEKIFIHFLLKKPDGYDLLSNIDKCLIITDKSYTEKLIELLKNDNYDSILRVRLLIYSVICKSLDLNSVTLTTSDNYPDVIKQAITYINKNLHASLSIDQICKHIYCSRSKLQNLFKQSLNIPLGQYIDDRILVECEKSLINSNLSIKEISDKLGFCDQFYLSRKFKNKYGVSPITYRKTLNI